MLFLVFIAQSTLNLRKLEDKTKKIGKTGLRTKNDPKLHFSKINQKS
jgi:hypothetical protein